MSTNILRIDNESIIDEIQKLTIETINEATTRGAGLTCAGT